MGYICDYCGEQRSMVYCRSDAAFLCLSCDRNVHSANALSKRHSRTLVCERCNVQPAYVRCIDEGASLCQNCFMVGHDGSTTSSLHKQQSISYYSGCPSAAELSKIWSFILNPLPSSDNSTCPEGIGLLSISESGANNNVDPVGEDDGQDAMDVVAGNDLQNINKSSVWYGPASITELVSRECPDQHGCAESSKLFNPTNRVPRFCEDDPLADLDLDEVDLNFENYDELFGVTLTHSERLLENGGINSLFRRQGMSTTDSEGQGGFSVEGASAGNTGQVQPACSNAASADSLMSVKTEPNPGIAAKQAHSNLSFSGITRESSGGDYQDCGASSMLLLGEPPWCPPCPDSSIQSASRTEAVMRYKEKKKARKFEKRVRYASRKARADVRKRVKGRFVKAGDAYDYDPLSTRSY
ncbi:zinc finger protein CONSTANS-LIKE 10-like [Chenopodium quinoa]|uniref:Zinc finger protein CONSTANS-LIKE 9-like n=1 Tax=Chenopodium quinoa TaxID=63459 RepID=A0A803MY60_CHEQI|nr:zinc finger protein CONSTANS-LIKE 10-like [Chenopodium quinoa]XP_021776472.1 zinc finger protein CONSTANS-LIKE 10-like [Chenopodium quinoa]